jgi:Cytochrome c554 and c-prime
MKLRHYLVTAALLGTVALTLVLTGDTTRIAGAAEDAPPPLVVDKEKPLLLDKPAQPAQETKPGTRADNSACLVCHANYTKEFLAGHHSLQNIGCVKCHGDSFAHRNDENNTTPPDKMFPRERIDPMCGRCHHSHDVAPSKVVERWYKRSEGKPMPEVIVCTDCHGRHRLKVRTVRWDKNTGKLLPKEEEKEGAKE